MCSVAKCLFPRPRPARSLQLLLPRLSLMHHECIINASATPAASGRPAHWHTALGDLSEGLASPSSGVGPGPTLPAPPLAPGQPCRQARGKTRLPVLKAFVAAGPARRALLSIRGPCERGAFCSRRSLFIFKRKKKIDVLSPPRTGTASRRSAFSPLCAALTAGRCPRSLHSARSHQHHHACQASGEPAWALGLPPKLLFFCPERLRAHERPVSGSHTGWTARAASTAWKLLHKSRPDRHLEPQADARLSPPGSSLAPPAHERVAWILPELAAPSGPLFTAKARPCPAA